MSGNNVKQKTHSKRKHLSKDLREQVLKRDNYCCRMCLSDKDIEIHELTPQTLGGELSLDNCFTFCYKCHLHIHNLKYYKLLGKESTKEGLRLAKLNGKKLGRPFGSRDKMPRKRDGYIARWNRK